MLMSFSLVLGNISVLFRTSVCSFLQLLCLFIGLCLSFRWVLIFCCSISFVLGTEHENLKNKYHEESESLKKKYLEECSEWKLLYNEGIGIAASSADIDH